MSGTLFDPRVADLVDDFYVNLHGVQDYLEEMEKAIPLAEKNRQEILDQEESEGKWDWEGYNINQQIVEMTFNKSLPRILSYSIITYLYTIVEVELFSIAKNLREQKNFELKINEIAGNGIEKAKIYLTKVAKINVSNDSSWNTLQDLRCLRNVIVHRMGKQGDENQRKTINMLIKKYGDQITLIGDNDDSQIIVSTKLCRHFIVEILGFFDRLFKECGYIS